MADPVGDRSESRLRVGPSGPPDTAGCRFRLAVAVESDRALAPRAFAHDPDGDPAILAEARSAVLAYLAAAPGPS